MERRDSSLPLVSTESKTEIGNSLNHVVKFLVFLMEYDCPFINSLNTKQKVERTGKILMAIGNVIRRTDWEHVKKCTVTTKSIIHWINHVFDENINPGGYDGIRRTFLRPLMLAGLIKQPSDVSRNNPTRGFYLSDEFVNHMVGMLPKSTLRQIKISAKELADICKEKCQALVSSTTKGDEARLLDSLHVDIGDGKSICLEKGGHNLLQKAVIDCFLPQYDPNFKILYLGDANDRYLIYNKQALDLLGVADLTNNQKLPDLLVWCPTFDSILVVEAVHSSGAVTEMRIAELNDLFEKVDVQLSYLTVFKDRTMFRKFCTTIGNNSMVWLMDETDHVIKYEPLIKPVETLVDCIIEY